MFGTSDCAVRWLRRLGAMTAIGLLLATAGPGQASAETRTLRLYNVHNKERAEIPYKRNGRYLSDGLKQVNQFLRDWRRNEPTQIDPQLIDLVWEAYRQSGSRDYIHGVSSYRSPATNSMLRSRSSGVAKESQHTRGKAMDFFIPDVPIRRLREIGLRMQVGGVGYYPKSGSPFVHFDVGSARHWPRMSRKELVAVFPNGGTVHVPSDGKPLPGYQEAMAAYKQRRASGDVQVANVESGGGSGGGKTLLAFLFGGGSDEQEDTAEAAAPAQAAPAPAQTRVAAVAPSNRPALPNGTSVAVPDDFDTSAPAGRPAEAPVAVAELRNVPVPTFAIRQPSAGTDLPAAAPSEALTDTLVAALDDQAAREASGGASQSQLAYAVPMPTDRPVFDAVLGAAPPSAPAAPPPAEAAEAPATSEPAPVAPAPAAQTALAALTPTPRPEAPSAAPAETSPALALLPAAMPTARDPAPAPAEPAPSVIERALAPTPSAEAPAETTVAAASAPSGKSGRLSRADAAPLSGLSFVTQGDIASRIELAAIITGPEVRAQGAPALPDAGRLVSQTADAVLATGFSSERSAARTDQFAGSAVQFLPIAKFE